VVKPSMGAAPSPPSPSTSVIQRLVAAYGVLAREVEPERSGTAALIRTGDPGRALLRLRQEIAELAAVVEGGHAHAADKSAQARRLLAERGLSEAHADLLLEASQVSYWWLVARLASGSQPDPGLLEEAVRAGACGSRSRPIGEEAREASAEASERAVFGLLGRALSDAGLPADLFAELDLAEMARRPYLRGLLGGT
jgi:hypothetical protein